MDWSDTLIPDDDDSVASRRWKCPYCYQSYGQNLFLRRHLAKHIERGDHAGFLEHGKRAIQAGQCLYHSSAGEQCPVVGVHITAHRKNVEYFCEEHRCKADHSLNVAHKMENGRNKCSICARTGKRKQATQKNPVVSRTRHTASVESTQENQEVSVDIVESDAEILPVRTLDEENLRYDHANQNKVGAILRHKVDAENNDFLFRVQWTHGRVARTWEPSAHFIHRNKEGQWFDTTDVWLAYVKDDMGTFADLLFAQGRQGITPAMEEELFNLL